MTSPTSRAIIHLRSIAIAGLATSAACTTSPQALELRAAPFVVRDSSSSSVRLQLSLRSTSANESQNIEICNPIIAAAEGFTEGAWRQIGQSSLLRNTTLCSNVSVTNEYVLIGTTDIELASNKSPATGFSQYRVRIELPGGAVTSLPFSSLSR